MTDLYVKTNAVILHPEQDSDVYTFNSNSIIKNDSSIVVESISSDVSIPNPESSVIIAQEALVFSGNSGNGTGIPDAEYDNNSYLRKNGVWVKFNYVNYPVPSDTYLHTQVGLLNQFKLNALGQGLNPKEGFVTKNYLESLGIVVDGGTGVLVPSGPIFMETPPKPLGFNAIGRWDSIDLYWMPGKTLYSNHSHTIIYRSQTNSFGTATVLETVYGPSNYSDFTASVNTTYYYWIRFVSVAGVEGSLNNITGTDAVLSDDPSNLLELLVNEIRASQLHSSLLAPIESITAPGGITEQLLVNANAIVTESTTRAAQIASEAASRNLAIQAEAVARGTAISEAVSTLESADENIISKVDFITSVSNATFDTVKLWQFDINAESWLDSVGVPSVGSGYLRPNFSINTYLTSPSFTINGSVYQEVRLRIRKVGTPIWAGILQYTTTSSALFTIGNQVTISEPVYFGDFATIVFNMETNTNWNLSIITALRLQLSLVTDASNYFEFDWISIGRMGPGASIAAIVEERTVRTAALEAETNARLDLTATVEDNIASVNTQLTALTNTDVVLATQIASLSAGNLNQFDYGKIWYYDGSVDSWGGGSVVVPGWLRTTTGILFTSLATTVGGPAYPDGRKYIQVRARIRKVGSPVWNGQIFYVTSVEPSFTHSIIVAEPTYDVNNIALLTVDMTAPWITSSAIISFGVNLYTGLNSTNYYEIDWIAIGRPSPGASSADLELLQTAMVTADTALSNSITAANAAIAGKASQSALNTLQSQVTTIDGVVTTQGNSILSLNSQINPADINANVNFSSWSGTYPDGFSLWQSPGDISKYTGPYAYTGLNAVRFNTGAYNSGIQMVVNNQPNAQYVDIEIVFTLVSGNISGAGVHFSWYSDATSVTANARLIDVYSTPSLIYGKKSVAKFRLTRPTLAGTFGGFQFYVMANYYELGAVTAKDIIFDRVSIIRADASASLLVNHETRITTAENTITSQAGQLTTINSTLAGKADASAVNALQTQVTSINGNVASNSSDITQLKATASTGGGNLLPNSDFLNGTAGWTLQNNGGGFSHMQVNLLGDSYRAASINNLGFYRSGLQGDYLYAYRYGEGIPAQAGKRYCFSAYLSAFRGIGDVRMVFVNSANATLLYSISPGVDSNSASGPDLNSYNRQFTIAIAPAGTVKIWLEFVITDNGQSDEYLFVQRPMLEEVSATATGPSAYSSNTNDNYAKTAAVQVTAEAAASTANGAVARWEVKTTVGALTGGVGFYNDGVKTRFAIHADQFYVYSPGYNAFSLITEGSNVVMDGAFIKNASIDSAKINNLNASKIVAGTITTDKIQVGAVTSQVVGSIGTTGNYMPVSNTTNYSEYIAITNFTFSGSKAVINGTLSITIDGFSTSIVSVSVQSELRINNVSGSVNQSSVLHHHQADVVTTTSGIRHIQICVPLLGLAQPTPGTKNVGVVIYLNFKNSSGSSSLPGVGTQYVPSTFIVVQENKV